MRPSCSRNRLPSVRMVADGDHSQHSRVSSIVENVLQLSRRDSTRLGNEFGTWLEGFLASSARRCSRHDAEVRFARPTRILKCRFIIAPAPAVFCGICAKTPANTAACPTDMSRSTSLSGAVPPISARTSKWPIVALASIPPRPNRFSSLSLHRDRATPGLASSLPRTRNGAVLFYEQRQGGGAFSGSRFRGDPQRWEV